MCGLAGFFGISCSDTVDLLQRLNDALRHRGPDGSLIWIEKDRRAGLAHCRLAIVDLSHSGSQPMHSASGRYVISYNGEIYNFTDLRAELSGKGHRFFGTSDTEVIITAFDEWGIVESLSRLNGMFAVAAWDKKLNKGFLFRDRLGVKPLYYQWCGGALFFSSELTLPFARISTRSISRESLALFLEHGYVPGERSIYEGISKLKPGVIVAISPASAARHSFESTVVYWDVTKRINEIVLSRDEGMQESEAVERVNGALSKSVKARMIADVPLGAFLSGGIDSSLIVAHMQQASARPVRTFTIGFERASANEAPFARRIAEYLETDHTELYVTEDDALNVIPSLAHIYGEPFADSSQIPTFLLSKLTRSHVTVALSGDGGDELFGGYRNYMSALKYQRLLERFPRVSLLYLAKLLKDASAQRVLYYVLGDRLFTRVVNGAKLFSDTGPSSHFIPTSHLIRDCNSVRANGISGACEGNWVEQIMCRDLNGYLPDDILVKVDRASMAVALENRAPFVDDFNIFEIAWSIPFGHKLTCQGGKLVLKRALQEFLPKQLFDRPKHGFAVPLHAWLNGKLNGWMNDCISSDRLKREGYLQPRHVQSIRAYALKGDIFYNTRLWSICMFQCWLEQTRTIAASAA